METNIVSMETVMESHLGYWLRQVSNSVSGAFARKLEARGVSIAEWVALQLTQTQPAATITSIADATALTRGAVSKIARRLEEKGLIRRQPSPGDGRIQPLGLTPKAVRLLPILTALAAENEHEFFAHLSQSDRDALDRILRDVVKHNNLRGVPVE
jgi:DNA-binding MarR family transcriptional regulator